MPSDGKFPRDDGLVGIRLRLQSMRDAANDDLGGAGFEVRQNLHSPPQALDKETPIGIEHDLDDGHIFQRPADGFA